MAEAGYDELCAQAKLALKQRKPQAAIELFKQAVALDGTRAEALEGLGTVSFLIGDCEAAVQHFLQVTRVKPRHAPGWVNLGAVYNRAGNPTKALEALKRSIQINKRSAEAHYNLGIAHRKLNQPALAIPAYREAIRLDPKMVEAHQNLGNAYLEMGNNQQAIMCFKKALEVNPTFDKALQSLAAAEAAVRSARADFNPFGRLVKDPAAVDGAAGVHADQCRVLTQDEQVQDRAELHRLQREVHQATQGLLKYLRDKLEPGVRGVARGLGGDAAHQGGLLGAAEKLTALVGGFQGYDDSLTRAMAGLAAHERAMKK